jgi:hypothetical protein
MKPRFPYGSDDESALASGSTSPPCEPGFSARPVCLEDRACCCPAPPLVRAIMPATPERPHPADLLLCGHHYRVSRQALIAAGARIFNLPGRADAAAAALLDPARSPEDAGRPDARLAR